jgi:hypothetical protein
MVTACWCSAVFTVWCDGCSSTIHCMRTVLALAFTLLQLLNWSMQCVHAAQSVTHASSAFGSITWIDLSCSWRWLLLLLLPGTWPRVATGVRATTCPHALTLPSWPCASGWTSMQGEASPGLSTCRCAVEAGWDAAE